MIPTAVVNATAIATGSPWARAFEDDRLHVVTAQQPGQGHAGQASAHDHDAHRNERSPESFSMAWLVSRSLT